MLPQLIHHSYTRSTRDVNTNLPHGLSNLYSSLTPRGIGKQALLPPLSIQTSSNKTSSKLKSVLQERRIIKDLQKNQEKKERIFKGKIAETLWDNFQIYINYKDLSQNTAEQIVEKAVYIHKYRELNKYASRIQKFWKKYSFNKGKRFIELQREIAALKIQSLWKNYKRKVLNPRLQRNREEKAAVTIQRYYRGYRYRMNYLVIKGRKQIEENMKFFDSVRDEMIRESALTILKHWRAYQVIFI